MTVLEEAPENASPLLETEIKWRDRYNMLESHGYRLRQRYRPDWKPSWTGKRLPEKYEDFYSNSSSVTIDAIRISDGRRVFLKRVRFYTRELAITRFLSEKERLDEPDNHSVPLLDEFADDNDAMVVYMVMPLLRPFCEPDFYSVDEVVDFMRQLLEGLVYMHKLDIAHRDCADLNIMMDADKMFPRGFHPYTLLADASGFYRANYKRRRSVGYVRYYFIDFGISTMFTPNESNKKVVGIQGQDDEVPELSETKPYDPFFVDIFILGNLFTRNFLERYTNLEFLRPLIGAMTADWALDRCKASTALRMFNEIIIMQSDFTLRWRLKERNVGRATQFFQDVGTALRETAYVSKNNIRSFFGIKTDIRASLISRYYF